LGVKAALYFLFHIAFFGPYSLYKGTAELCQS
jgi:hypothetical protein